MKNKVQDLGVNNQGERDFEKKTNHLLINSITWAAVKLHLEILSGAAWKKDKQEEKNIE